MGLAPPEPPEVIGARESTLGLVVLMVMVFLKRLMNLRGHFVHGTFIRKIESYELTNFGMKRKCAWDL